MSLAFTDLNTDVSVIAAGDRVRRHRQRRIRVDGVLERGRDLVDGVGRRDVHHHVLAADVEMDRPGRGRRRGDRDHAGGGDGGGRLLERQAPHFVRPVVGEERLEHAAELGAHAERLVGLRLARDRQRDIGRRLAVGGHHADQQRPQIDRRQARHRRIDFDPVKRDLDIGGNIRERDRHDGDLSVRGLLSRVAAARRRSAVLRALVGRRLVFPLDRCRRRAAAW